jgi:hypothetical protein
MANSEPSVFLMISKACGRCLPRHSERRIAKKEGRHGLRGDEQSQGAEKIGIVEADIDAWLNENTPGPGKRGRPWPS